MYIQFPPEILPAVFWIGGKEKKVALLREGRIARGSYIFTFLLPLTLYLPWPRFSRLSPPYSLCSGTTQWFRPFSDIGPSLFPPSTQSRERFWEKKDRPATIGKTNLLVTMCSDGFVWAGEGYLDTSLFFKYMNIYIPICLYTQVAQTPVAFFFILKSKSN